MPTTDSVVDKSVIPASRDIAFLAEPLRPIVRQRDPAAACQPNAGFRHWLSHLAEMYGKLNGEITYLWRAVDHEGEILEGYVTKSRDKAAALRFMRRP